MSRKFREMVQKLDQSLRRPGTVQKSARLSQRHAMEFIQKSADELGVEDPSLSPQQRFARILKESPNVGGLACGYSWEEVTGDYSGL